MTTKHEAPSEPGGAVRDLAELFTRMEGLLALEQAKVERAAGERERLSSEQARLAESRDRHEREAAAALESEDDAAARRALGRLLPLDRVLRELELQAKGAARHHEALVGATSERKRTLAELRGRLDRYETGASDAEIELELLRRKKRQADG